jgi:hypothetical protein
MFDFAPTPPRADDQIDPLLWLTTVLPRVHRRRSQALRFFVVFRVTPR